jgi:O-antigen/teichoic acid export membrane protein
MAQLEAPVTVRAPGRILRGSIFELSAHGVQQVVRLGSNLLTTRLLFPAAFGESSIVWALSTALLMFSDVALLPCIIQSKRGDEEDFLNTAFTVQVIRGVALGLVMILLAKPVAWFYHDPALVPLVCLGSLQLMFNAFHSTKMYSLRRWLRLGWVNAYDTAQLFFTIATTIGLAWYSREAWSLVLGTVIGTFVFTIVTHFMPVPYRNRFRLEKAALHEIRTFGRWVLGSSVASFVGGQADRIMLGRFLGSAVLGVYAVAITVSDGIGAAITRLINSVMFPVLTEAGRETVSHLADLYYRLRKRLDLLSMGLTGAMAGAGGWLVRLLWDSRYADAAWMLQIICVRVGVSALVSSGEICLFALGHTRYVFQRSVARLVGSLVLLPAGWYLGGVKGLIWGAVGAEAVALVAIWPKSYALGILRVRRELVSIAIFAAGYGLGRLALPLLPVLHLR